MPDSNPAPVTMRWQCYCDYCRKVIYTRDAYYCWKRDATLCAECYLDKESTPCPK
jgi:hypothetical protein